MKYLSKSLDETKMLAQAFLNTLEKGETGTVVALEGDLGSGKTTFSQSIGDILGVREVMQSPTFVIEKIYEIKFQGFTHLIHIDAYRLERIEELLHLGWEEITQRPENLILIEWPERVKEIIPLSAKRICFNFVDETTREVEFEKELEPFNLSEGENYGS